MRYINLNIRAASARESERETKVKLKIFDLRLSHQFENFIAFNHSRQWDQMMSKKAFDSERSEREKRVDMFQLNCVYASGKS